MSRAEFIPSKVAGVLVHDFKVVTLTSIEKVTLIELIRWASSHVGDGTTPVSEPAQVRALRSVMTKLV
jgi:hypothetical protein